uniref:Uncharacterized protein n=1 Tax=Nonomuraea gerenzanensis TaxID=93944 RepID=A0A1M4E5T2_9ACTN|nr:hypothetical protein BN4615_P3634 [Nonomuraea gerenzanensis]
MSQTLTNSGRPHYAPGTRGTDKPVTGVRGASSLVLDLGTRSGRRATAGWIFLGRVGALNRHRMGDRGLPALARQAKEWL